jgi:hypothetical protein
MAYNSYANRAVDSRQVFAVNPPITRFVISL